MKKILIVEDTRDYAENMEYLLSQEGYEVVIANNGIEGVDKALTFNPHLILMDIMMPEQDGVATTQRIKELEGLKEVPVIFLTSVIGGQDAVVSVEGQDYPAISKMTDYKDLLKNIRKLLQ